MNLKNKKRIGIFSFTGCEGCALTFIELFNIYWDKWKDNVDIVYCKQLKKKNTYKNIDIAIIDGAITTKNDLDTVKKIRKNSIKVILIGSCAITGYPSNYRNNFNKEKLYTLQSFLNKWKYLNKVISIKDVINVDFEINGCPVDEKKFIDLFEKLIF